jgi:hypothetical protein
MTSQFLWHKSPHSTYPHPIRQRVNNLARREGLSLQQFIAFAVRERLRTNL